MEKPVIHSRLLEQIAPALPKDKPVYLVGGGVRDFLLNRETKDYDFAMDSGSLETARQVADILRAGYYPLDEMRHTGRVVLVQEDGSRIFLDFALLRGPNLESDYPPG